MQRRTAGTLATTAATGLALALTPSAGAAGLDPTFGTGGTALTPLSAVASDRYLATAPAPDGGTYNGGYTTVSGTNRAFAVTKTKADGSLDESFGAGGLATVDVATGPFIAGASVNGGPAQAAPTGSGEGIRGIAVQPNGKIVVLGQAETVQNGTKGDSRDTDVYVARFNVNGTLDATFGTGGVTRIDLSDGRPKDPTPTPAIPATPTTPAVPANPGQTTNLNGDQAGYNVEVRPDGRVLLTLSKGIDFAEQSRTDRTVVIAQLKANGTPDTTFGTGGFTSINPDAAVSENPRRGLLLPDGKYVTTAYGNPGTGNRPYLLRVNADGTPDTTFGSATGAAAGSVTAQVAGATGSAEAYSIHLHQGKYAVVGYGRRGTAAQANNQNDVLLFRFNPDGTWDQAFGVDGLVNYDRLNPAGPADSPTGHFSENGRDMVVTPDERFVIAGQSGPDALTLVLKPDGTADTSVAPDGAIITDLGGTADAFWGAAVTKASGTKVRVAGYSGFAPASAAQEDAALQQVDLTVPPAVVPPVTPAPAVPAPAAPTPTTPAPATPVAPKPSRTVGKVTVSGKRIGAKKNRVRVTLKLERSGKGRVSISAKRSAKGAKAVSAKGTVSSKGTLVVTLKTGKKGRYVLTIKAPTPAGGTQTIKRTITVR